MIGAQTPTNPKKESPQKYTVKEVFDSLYWEVLDCDDDYDGYLHIVSTINGAEIKLNIKELILSIPLNKNTP